MKIAIIGTGKMGTAVEKIAVSKGHEIVVRINNTNTELLLSEAFKSADVAIEFSTPDACIQNLMACLNAGIPVICGTTGWQSNYPSIKKIFLEKDGALICSSNFSVGVNIVFEINKLLSKMMNGHSDYHAEIEEIHHTQKLDCPSGTAITLAEGLISESSTLKDWQLQDKMVDYNTTLPILSRRIDDVIGVHDVIWKSNIDKISIHHEAFTRDGFANGAVVAGEWIVGKKGVFTMKDVLFN